MFENIFKNAGELTGKILKETVMAPVDFTIGMYEGIMSEEEPKKKKSKKDKNEENIIDTEIFPRGV